MQIYAKIIIAASGFGFLNAVTLFILYLAAIFSPDHAESIGDINEMLSFSGTITSPVVQIMGMPIGSIAMFVYPLLGGLGYWALTSRKPQNQYFAISIIASMGLTLNVITNYNEYHFLHSICLICLLCLGIISTILISSIMGFYRITNKK